jgi:hypothetical protein
MTDAFGDGWNGSTATITDMVSGQIVASATLATGSSGTQQFCLADGCYQISVSQGSFPTEVGWVLLGTNSGVLTGGAPVTGTLFSVGSGACVVGCMEPVACNYDPNATIGDCTLCEYSSCLGCTYSTACNYNAAANAHIDDGSCDFSCLAGTATCMGDLDGNHIVNVNDLSLFLSVFGTVCP